MNRLVGFGKGDGEKQIRLLRGGRTVFREDNSALLPFPPCGPKQCVLLDLGEGRNAVGPSWEGRKENPRNDGRSNEARRDRGVFGRSVGKTSFGSAVDAFEPPNAKWKWLRVHRRRPQEKRETVLAGKRGPACPRSGVADGWHRFDVCGGKKVQVDFRPSLSSADQDRRARPRRCVRSHLRHVRFAKRNPGGFPHRYAFSPSPGVERAQMRNERGGVSFETRFYWERSDRRTGSSGNKPKAVLRSSQLWSLATNSRRDLSRPISTSKLCR